MKFTPLLFYPFGILLLFQCSGSALEKNPAFNVPEHDLVKVSSQKVNGVSFVSTAKEIGSLEIQQPKIKLNANYLCFMPYGFVDEGSTELIFNSKWQWWGEKDTGLNRMIELAQTAGYKVMLKPHVWKKNGAYTGEHGHENAEEWNAFELSYTKYILHFAEIAEKNKMALFCIGTEWENFVLQRSEFWFELIKKVRKVYSGKLTYAANWDEYLKVLFWNKLDCIGIDAYFPLIDAKTPKIIDLEKALIPYKNALKKMTDSLQKQVLFTEYGYRSRDNTAYKPWEADRSGSVNQQAQVNAYTAFYNAFWQESYICGGFLWKWFPNNKDAGGSEDNGFTPQNKAVEKVIKLNYEKTNLN